MSSHLLAVASRYTSLRHDSAMDSSTEDPVIDPKLLAQVDNLETQYNPDFDLGFESG